LKSTAPTGRSEIFAPPSPAGGRIGGAARCPPHYLRLYGKKTNRGVVTLPEPWDTPPEMFDSVELAEPPPPPDAAFTLKPVVVAFWLVIVLLPLTLRVVVSVPLPAAKPMSTACEPPPPAPVVVDDAPATEVEDDSEPAPPGLIIAPADAVPASKAALATPPSRIANLLIRMSTISPCAIYRGALNPLPPTGAVLRSSVRYAREPPPHS